MTTSSSPAAIWQAAASFAAWRHRHQIRKDGRTPYIAHPFRVAMTVRDVFGCDDPVVIAAALLHDTIEDTLTDYDELAELFSVQIADLVASLTKNMALPEPQRESEYDARLTTADWRAKLIKLADVYDNFSDLPNRSPESLEDVRKKCRRAVTIAQGDAGSHPVLERAIAVVQKLIEQPEQ